MLVCRPSALRMEWDACALTNAPLLPLLVLLLPLLVLLPFSR